MYYASYTKSDSEYNFVNIFICKLYLLQKPLFWLCSRGWRRLTPDCQTDYWFLRTALTSNKIPVCPHDGHYLLLLIIPRLLRTICAGCPDQTISPSPAAPVPSLMWQDQSVRPLRPRLRLWSGHQRQHGITVLQIPGITRTPPAGIKEILQIDAKNIFSCILNVTTPPNWRKCGWFSALPNSPNIPPPSSLVLENIRRAGRGRERERLSLINNNDIPGSWEASEGMMVLSVVGSGK